MDERKQEPDKWLSKSLLEEVCKNITTEFFRFHYTTIAAVLYVQTDPLSIHLICRIHLYALWYSN